MKRAGVFNAGSFLCYKRGADMEKSIYCPNCNRKVSTWDGKSTINIITSCRKCKKKVVYFVDTRETILKPLPPRTDSSGKRFY